MPAYGQILSHMSFQILPPLHLLLKGVKSIIWFYVSVFQVEVRDHRDYGGRCEATPPHVVMEVHSASSDDGKMLQRTVQDKDHQQETPRGSSKAPRGGTSLN